MLKQESTVTVTGFQVEPGVSRLDLSMVADRSTIHVMPEQNTAGLESLMFSLRFRNWLSDSEKNLLDMLAPQHAVTFLVHDGHYLHPEDVELFPMDVIDSSLNRGGEAIFIHRYQPESGSSNDCYKIHTARFGMLRGQELIIGILGPDRLAGSGQFEDHFSRLVNACRRVWRETDTAVESLKARLAPSQPTAIINRASGRVIVASNMLAERLKTKTHAITDIEAGELLKTIRQIDPAAKLQMDNMKTCGLHLSVGTVELSTRGRTKAADNFPAESSFIIHGIRNRLAAISTAAGHLETVLAGQLRDEDSELLQIIQNESEAVDRFIEQLRLLLYGEQLTPVEVMLAAEIETAVETASKLFGKNARIVVELGDTAKVARIVPGAFRTLVETTLRSHLVDPRQNSHTLITASPRSASLEVKIASQPGEGGKELTLGSNWQKYTGRLAERMGVQYQHVSEPNRRLLTTTLTISTKTE